MNDDPSALRAAAGVMFYAGPGADGSPLPVPGVLPAALEAARAGCRALVVAAEDTAEARLAPGVTVTGAARLAEVTGWLSGGPVPQATVPGLGDRPLTVTTQERIARAALTYQARRNRLPGTGPCPALRRLRDSGVPGDPAAPGTGSASSGR